MGIVSYAQNFEDVLLHRVFAGEHYAFYVDIGAYHPVQDSVTKAFYDRGWDGLNIEPGEIFAELAAARPRDINLQMAVLDHAGSVSFAQHPGWYAGLSHVEPDAPAGSEAEAGPVTITYRTVACDTLGNILDRYAKGRPIAFLKIDAEGAEDAIIGSTDWRAIRPTVLVIEATKPRSTVLDNARWEPRLIEGGYRRAYFDGINCFYVPEERADLLRHFDMPVNVLDGFQRYDPRLAAAEAQVASAQARGDALAAELAAARAEHGDERAQHEQLHAADRVKAAGLQQALSEAHDQLAAVRRRLDALPAEQNAAITAVAEAHAFQAAELRRQVADLEAQCTAARFDRERAVGTLEARLEAVARERDSLAPLRSEAARLRRLLRELQWPDGPAALRAVLPLARLLRRLRGTPIPPVPPEEAALLAPPPPSEASAGAAPSAAGPAVPPPRRSLAKRAAWVAYRPFRPLGRPAALRLRAFLTLQLQAEFRQLDARLGRLGEELAHAAARPMPPIPPPAAAPPDPRIAELQTEIRQFGKLLEDTLLTLAMEGIAGERDG